MRIFITGGTGFIGKPLLKNLSGHDVLLLSRNAPSNIPANVKIISADIFEPSSYREALKAFNPEAVLHLAWSDIPDFSLPKCQKNFAAGIELIKFLTDLKCPRIVIPGSAFEYGNLTGLVNETMRPEKMGLFPSFKLAQYTVAQSLCAAAGTTLVWGRLLFVYGPEQRPGSLLPSCINALTGGNRPDIRSPDVINDFVYVDDVADALAKMATINGPSGIYNIGSGIGTKVREVVNLVARSMKLNEIYPASENTGTGFWADISKTKKDYGWQPRVNLQQGVETTVASFLNSSAAISK